MTQLLITLLMIDALIVAIGLKQKKNMWKWIVLYWIILTLKNTIDFITF